MKKVKKNFKRGNKFFDKFKNRKILWLISIILILIIIGLIIFVSIQNSKKINNEFSLSKENIKIDTKDNKIDLKIEIKNTTAKAQKINNISLNIVNNEGQKVFFYYKNVDREIDSKKTYELNITEDINNSNLSNTKDIKDIEYEINS